MQTPSRYSVAHISDDLLSALMRILFMAGHKSHIIIAFTLASPRSANKSYFGLQEEKKENDRLKTYRNRVQCHGKFGDAKAQNSRTNKPKIGNKVKWPTVADNRWISSFSFSVYFHSHKRVPLRTHTHTRAETNARATK